ncbi:MAG: hypothetical protein RDV48_10985 [Candidatus Eremiobacteraeota bacterium]|nr:hypothetical protein [Candidatus Eremiobacteraeota bacterium]
MRRLLMLIAKIQASILRALEKLPFWADTVRFASFLCSPVVKSAAFALKVFPGLRRLDGLLEIESLRRRHPILLAFSLIYVLWRGLRITNLGHIGTDPIIYPLIGALSGFNPFLGMACGVIYGIGDLIQKLFKPDMYGAKGWEDPNYWGAMAGYAVSYSSLVIMGLLPGLLARISGLIVRAILRRIFFRRMAASADGAQPAAAVTYSFAELLARVAGAYAGGYVVMDKIAPVTELPAFYWRPHPDVSCHHLEVNTHLRGRADIGATGSSIGALVSPPPEEPPPLYTYQVAMKVMPASIAADGRSGAWIYAWVYTQDPAWAALTSSITFTLSGAQGSWVRLSGQQFTGTYQMAYATALMPGEVKGKGPFSAGVTASCVTPAGPRAAQKTIILMPSTQGRLVVSTQPEGKGALVPDGKDTLWVWARPELPDESPPEKYEAILATLHFEKTGPHADWCILGPRTDTVGYKGVYCMASPPGGDMKQTPPPSVSISITARDGDSILAAAHTVKLLPLPVLKAAPLRPNVIFGAPGPTEVKIAVENPGAGKWEFSAETASPEALSVEVEVIDQNRARVLLKALKEPSPGEARQDYYLTVKAEREGFVLEEELRVSLARTGIVLDPPSFTITGNGKSFKTLYAAVMVPVQGKGIVNDVKASRHLIFEIDEATDKKTRNYFTFLAFECWDADCNEERAGYKVNTIKEVPAEERKLKATYKVTASTSGEGLRYVENLEVTMIPIYNGPGSDDWLRELENTRTIIDKYVPESYRPDFHRILEKKAQLLGAEGLVELRRRIFNIACLLIEADGLKGYEDVDKWATRITTVLNIAEWGGDLAFQALASTYMGPVAAMFASYMKSLFISAVVAYNNGDSVESWVNSNFSLSMLTDMGISLAEGTVVNIETIRKYVKSPHKAWAVFCTYHFLKNIYKGQSLVEAARNAARTATEEALVTWLGGKLRQNGVKVEEGGEPGDDGGKKPKDGDDAGKKPKDDGSKKKPEDDGGKKPDGPAKEFLDGLEKKYPKGTDRMDPKEVLDIQSDPQKVRTLKEGPEYLQKAYNETLKKEFYDKHDSDLKNWARDNVPGMKDKTLRVDDFRTPGSKESSVNTDRDYRLQYYNSADGKWYEVPLKNWEQHSRQWYKDRGLDADGLNQMPTDRHHNESSTDYATEHIDPATGKKVATETDADTGQQKSPIQDVKDGKAALKDPEDLGRMYHTKVLEAKTPPEKIAQLQKSVSTLQKLANAYKKMGYNVKDVPPRLKKAMELLVDGDGKKVPGADDYSNLNATPEKIAEFNRKLNEAGYRDIDAAAKDSGDLMGTLKIAQKGSPSPGPSTPPESPLTWHDQGYQDDKEQQ